MDNLLISALSAVDVRDLSYAKWMNVGMALKHEGYACTVWDEWSRNDQRYHPGECARKWKPTWASGTAQFTMNKRAGNGSKDGDEACGKRNQHAVSSAWYRRAALHPRKAAWA